MQPHAAEHQGREGMCPRFAFCALCALHLDHHV
jgi:hypothetical protein